MFVQGWSYASTTVQEFTSWTGWRCTEPRLCSFLTGITSRRLEAFHRRPSYVAFILQLDQLSAAQSQVHPTWVPGIKRLKLGCRWCHYFVDLFSTCCFYIFLLKFSDLSRLKPSFFDINDSQHATSVLWYLSPYVTRNKLKRVKMGKR